MPLISQVYWLNEVDEDYQLSTKELELVSFLVVYVHEIKNKNATKTN